MSLLDSLLGRRAQVPGQASPFQNILAPEVALPTAMMLMGGQGNAQNFANAAGVLGPAMGQQRELQAQTAQENATGQWLRTQDPRYAQMLDAGLKPKDVYGVWFEDRKVQENKAPNSVQEFEYAVKTGAFNGNYTDWQTKGIREQDPTFTRERELRGQYDDDENVKNYKIVRDNYERIREGASLSTGAGDIAVIFGYMKMLDPTSVVRENEQATAQNAGGVPAHIRNLYNKTLYGDLLPPESRAQIVQAADTIYSKASDNLSDTNTRYGGVADRYGLERSGITQEPEVYQPLNLGQVKDMGNGVTIKRVK